MKFSIPGMEDFHLPVVHSGTTAKSIGFDSDLST